MSAETRFYVLTDDPSNVLNDVEAEAVVKITDEGIIVDLEVDGEVIKTWGATAQELADEFCH